MNRIHILLLFTLITIANCSPKFNDKRQFFECIDICKTPISHCLNDYNSACAKAYAGCHQSQDFLKCLESSNGIFVQEVSKCMNLNCMDIPLK